MREVSFRQAMIWDDLQRELPPGLKEVARFLEALPCDEVIAELQLERGRGRDDYPVAPMCRLLLVQLYLRHGRFSQLLGELRRNNDLARVLGFEEKLPGRFQIPTPSAMSRFHTKLKAGKYLKKFERTFAETVRTLKQEHPALGTHTGLDASDIRTHGHPARKDRAGNEQPATDSEASWSVKTKRWEDGQGKKREEVRSTFGYKMYLCTDVEIPAVLSVLTATGKTNDHGMAMTVLNAAIENVGPGKIKTCAMDKGFDSEENVRDAYGREVAAIIPVRDVPENLEQLPREDREVAVSESSNIVRDLYSGEVACYEFEGGNAVRRTMKYGGFEKDRGTHKFRCPLGAAAAGGCSAFSVCSAGSSGEQGRQLRIPMETDFRRFAPVYPQTKRWSRLYSGRTATERINSYLKGVLRLEDHCVRGKAAVSLRVLLAAITINVRTILTLRAEKRRGKKASAA